MASPTVKFTWRIKRLPTCTTRNDAHLTHVVKIHIIHSLCPRPAFYAPHFIACGACGARHAARLRQEQFSAVREGENIEHNWASTRVRVRVFHRHGGAPTSVAYECVGENGGVSWICKTNSWIRWYYDVAFAQVKSIVHVGEWLLCVRVYVGASHRRSESALRQIPNRLRP